MHKNFITLTILIMFSAHSQATQVSFPNSDPQQTATVRTLLEPSEELMDFLRLGVKDCEKILMEADPTKLRGMCLNYSILCVDLQEEMQRYIPERYRAFTAESERFISLISTTNSKDLLHIPLDDMVEAVFLKKPFNDITQRQITLCMIYKYFKLLCDLHFLKQGLSTNSNFLNIETFQVQNAKHRETLTARNKTGRQLKGNNINLQSEAEFLKERRNHCVEESKRTTQLFFGMFFGIAPLHFLSLHGDYNCLYLADTNYSTCISDPEAVLLMRSYYQTMLAIQMDKFSLKVKLSELEAIAPLKIGSRHKLLTQHIGRSLISKEISDALFPTTSSNGDDMMPGELQALKHSVLLAQEQMKGEIKPLQDKVALLEGQIKTLTAKNNALQLIHEKALQKSLKQQQSINNVQKNLDASRSENKKLKSKLKQQETDVLALRNQLAEQENTLSSLRAELKTRQTQTHELEQTCNKFVMLYESLCDKQRDMVLQLMDIRSGHIDSKNQIRQNTKKIEGITTHLEELRHEEDKETIDSLGAEMKATREKLESMDFANSKLIMHEFKAKIEECERLTSTNSILYSDNSRMFAEIMYLRHLFTQNAPQAIKPQPAEREEHIKQPMDTELTTRAEGSTQGD